MVEVAGWHLAEPFGRSIVDVHPDSLSEQQAENWFIHICNEEEGMYKEKEIYWRGRTVVVSLLDVSTNNYTFEKCHTLETCVKNVLFTKFKLSPDSHELEEGMCVLEKDCLNVFMSSGVSHVTPLPFRVKNMWPLNHGLCVEREILAYESEEDKKNMPTLFSLLHPLEDLKPIVFRYEDSQRCSYFTDSSQHIVYTDGNLVLIYDSVLGFHSVWSVQPAHENDIPDTSTQQDSLPDFLTLSNNHSMNFQPALVKDAHLPRASLSPAPSGGHNNKRHSCPPIPMQAWRASPSVTARATDQRNSPLVNSRSPANYTKNNSPHAPGNARRKSGMGEAKDSPFHRKSYMHSPLIFRMSCDESAMEEGFDPLPPDVCLKQVWMEPANLIRHGIKGKAESAFSTCDFLDQPYIGYFMKNLNKFRLVRLDSEGENISFEKVLEIDCLSVGAFKKLPMFAVLDMSQKVVLYSGKQKIGSLELSKLELNDVGRMNLNNFSADTFHMFVTKENIQRIQIHKPTYSLRIEKLIKELQNCLPAYEFNLSCAKYYFMLSEARTELWDTFVAASLKLMGFPEASVKDKSMCVSSSAPPTAKKAKKSDSFEGNEDWKYLLASRGRVTNKLHGIKEEIEENSCENEIIDISLLTHAPLYKNISKVFLTWHLQYEELKLKTLEINSLLPVAKLLHSIASVLKAQTHKTLYENEFPTLKTTSYNLVSKLPAPKNKQLDCIDIFSKIFNAVQSEKSFEYNIEDSKSSSILLKIVSLVTMHAEKCSMDTEDVLSELNLDNDKESLVDQIISLFMKADMSHKDIENLPLGYKLLVKELLNAVKLSTNDTSLKTGVFLDREDIVALQENKARRNNDSVTEDANNTDGMDFNTEILEMRFSEDLRVDEVRRLLDSSSQVNISLTQKPDVTDHAFAKEEEARLLLMWNRIMSLPVARGMFTMGTSSPVLSQPVFIPDLQLTAQSTTNNKTVQVNMADTNTFNLFKLWPSFHNGVAAGLKIAPRVSQMDSTWILFNKLKSTDVVADHAGFLFALGLTGHLSVLPKLYLHDYLTQFHEVTTVALLLGMCATKLGTKDRDVYKMLSLHLTSLLPPTNLELHIPQTSQVAALGGLGLLFYGTGDNHLARAMLREIGRPPGTEAKMSTDREGHALAAGFALGMILIGKGKDTTAVAGFNVKDVLYQYIIGGHKSEQLLSDYTKVDSPQIQEGDFVNTSITSSAAVLALSLMFLKTNNRLVSSWLRVPTNENTIDALKPDQLLLRMTAYNLVMWDEVVPTNNWLSSFIPQYKINKAGMVELLSPRYELHFHLIPAVAGCFLALALKFAGSHYSAAFHLMFPWLKYIKDTLKLPSMTEIGALVTLEQCLATVLLSLCLVMAGSGNLKLLRFARQLHKRCSSDVTYGNHMATNMAIGFLFLGGGSYTLKTDNLSVACLLMSLYPKWPASSKDNVFHLQAFRHLYVLACEERLFITRDVESKQLAFVPIQLTYKDMEQSYPETTIKMLSPCFLPEKKFLKKVAIVGSRYWPIVFDVEKSDDELKSLCNVFVKKRAGFLSYKSDPKGNNNLLAKGFLNGEAKLKQVRNYNSDEDLFLFAKEFCVTDSEEESLKRVCGTFVNMLHESVTEDKIHVLNDYLQTEQIMQSIEGNCADPLLEKQLDLLVTFYEHLYPRLAQRGLVLQNPLINSLYLTQISIRLKLAKERNN